MRPTYGYGYGFDKKKLLGDSWLSNFMASQSDGLWYDFSRTNRLFQETTGPTLADDPGDLIGLVLDQRISLDTDPTATPGNHATQSTIGFKPKYQAGGVSRFDVLDDYLAPDYTLQNGANFLVAKIAVVPNAATQVIFGVNGPGDANRIRLGIVGSGQLRVSVGGVDLTGTTDLRGQTVNVGLSVVSGDVRLFAGVQQEASSVVTFSIETTINPFIGARNNNGAPANFFGGDIHALMIGRQTINLDLFNRIASGL